MHKNYWKFVFRELMNFILRNKIKSLIAVFVVMLSVFTYLGYAQYITEFSFPFGTFKVGVVNKDTGENIGDPDSKKLDRSIFDLAKEIIATGLTSQERVNLISNISGLETKGERGKIEDIGTDGLTLLIRGNSVDGYPGLIRCDFSSNWKQRIFLLKKGSEINFMGIVSEYDLSRQWIYLKNCKLFE